jgi:hypothetical protein
LVRVAEINQNYLTAGISYYEAGIEKFCTLIKGCQPFIEAFLLEKKLIKVGNPLTTLNALTMSE